MNRRCRLKVCMDLLKAAKEGKPYSRLMQDVGINFKIWEELKHALYDADLLRMYIGRKQNGAWPSNKKKRSYGRKYETTVKGLNLLKTYNELISEFPVQC